MSPRQPSPEHEHAGDAGRAPDPRAPAPAASGRIESLAAELRDAVRALGGSGARLEPWRAAQLLGLADTLAEQLGRGHDELLAAGERARHLSESARVARAAAEATERRYHAVVETLPEGIWQLDAESRTVHANPRTTELLGCTLDVLRGRALEEFVPPPGLPRLRAAIERGRAGEKDAFPLHLRRADGTLLWARLVTLPLFDPDGRYVGALLRVSDLARDRRDEEALRLRTRLLDAVGQAVIATDLTGRVVYWNRAAEQLHGWPAAEALGADILELTATPESRDVALGIRGRLAAGECWSGEMRLRRRDGGTFPAEVTHWPMFDARGKLTGTVGIITDIAARKRGEAERAALLVAEREARREAAEAERRASFLARASNVLAGSLDLGTTLAALADLAVPEMGDWCIVHLVRDDGRIEDVAVVHADPARRDFYRQFLREYPPAPDLAHGHPEVIRTGRSELIPELSAPLLGDVVTSARHLRQLRRFAVRSYLCVPMTARGRTLGAMTFATAESGRRYGEADRELAEDLARRAALAVDNGRLHRETREALDRLRETVALLDAVFAATPVGLAFVDRDLRVERLNAYLQAHSTRPDASPAGQPIELLLPADLRDQVVALFRQVLATGAAIADQELSSTGLPAGRREFLASFYPVRDAQERVRWAGAAVMEVTDRKRAEERQRFLAEASALLAGSLEGPGSLVAVARLAVPRLADWVIVDVLERGATRRAAVVHHDPEKQRWADALLRHPEPAEGTRPRVLDTGRAEHVPEIREGALAEVFDDPGTLALARALGARSYLGVPLQARGRILGALGFVSAESERRYGPQDLALAEELARRAALAVDNARLYDEARAAQEALAQQAARLEQNVRQRTRELIETNDQMEAFTYSVSHDLRAPLRAVQGFADALLEDFGPGLPPEARGYAERMIAAARQMDQLIRDLLAYSRMTRADLVMEPVSLDRALDEASAALEREFTEHGARVHVERPLPLVRGHSAVLVQVLANLLANAVKFVPPGTRPEVRVHAEREDGRVRLWVEDNGIGIAPEHQDRIFGMFQRLHRVEQYPGTGVGLALVRKAVERLGGSSGVESVPGLGSRFWVELPAGEAPASLAEEGNPLRSAGQPLL